MSKLKRSNPSSSSKAASLLENCGHNTSSEVSTALWNVFEEFSNTYNSGISTNCETMELNGLDPTLIPIFRNMTKKDTETRIKGLKTLFEKMNLYKSASKDLVLSPINWNSCISHFAYVYIRLGVYDSNIQIRKLANECLYLLHNIVGGEAITKYATQLFPALWISCSDTRLEVSKAAEFCLESLITKNRDTRIYYLINYCKINLFSIYGKILGCNISSLKDELNVDTSSLIEEEELYDRLISTSMGSIRNTLRNLIKTNIELAISMASYFVFANFPDIISKLIEDSDLLFINKYIKSGILWKFISRSYRSSVRVSSIQTLQLSLRILRDNFPNMDLSKYVYPLKNTFINTMKCLDDYKDISVQSVSFEFTVVYFQVFPSIWNQSTIEEPLITFYKVLFTCLKKPNLLCCDLLYSNLPFILKYIPIEILLEQANSKLSSDKQIYIHLDNSTFSTNNIIPGNTLSLCSLITSNTYLNIPILCSLPLLILSSILQDSNTTEQCRRNMVLENWFFTIGIPNKTLFLSSVKSYYEILILLVSEITNYRGDTNYDSLIESLYKYYSNIMWSPLTLSLTSLIDNIKGDLDQKTYHRYQLQFSSTLEASKPLHKIAIEECYKYKLLDALESLSYCLQQYWKGIFDSFESSLTEKFCNKDMNLNKFEITHLFPYFVANYLEVCPQFISYIFDWWNLLFGKVFNILRNRHEALNLDRCLKFIKEFALKLLIPSLLNSKCSSSFSIFIQQFKELINLFSEGDLDIVIVSNILQSIISPFLMIDNESFPRKIFFRNLIESIQVLPQVYTFLLWSVIYGFLTEYLDVTEIHSYWNSTSVSFPINSDSIGDIVDWMNNTRSVIYKINSCNKVEKGSDKDSKRTIEIIYINILKLLECLCQTHFIKNRVFHITLEKLGLNEFLEVSNCLALELPHPTYTVSLGELPSYIKSVSEVYKTVCKLIAIYIELSNDYIEDILDYIVTLFMYYIPEILYKYDGTKNDLYELLDKVLLIIFKGYPEIHMKLILDLRGFFLYITCGILTTEYSNSYYKLEQESLILDNPRDKLTLRWNEPINKYLYSEYSNINSMIYRIAVIMHREINLQLPSKTNFIFVLKEIVKQFGLEKFYNSTEIRYNILGTESIFLNKFIRIYLDLCKWTGDNIENSLSEHLELDCNFFHRFCWQILVQIISSQWCLKQFNILKKLYKYSNESSKSSNYSLIPFSEGSGNNLFNLFDPNVEIYQEDFLNCNFTSSLYKYISNNDVKYLYNLKFCLQSVLSAHSLNNCQNCSYQKYGIINLLLNIIFYNNSTQIKGNMLDGILSLITELLNDNIPNIAILLECTLNICESNTDLSCNFHDIIHILDKLQVNSWQTIRQIIANSEVMEYEDMNELHRFNDLILCKNSLFSRKLIDNELIGVDSLYTSIECLEYFLSILDTSFTLESLHDTEYLNLNMITTLCQSIASILLNISNFIDRETTNIFDIWNINGEKEKLVNSMYSMILPGEKYDLLRNFINLEVIFHRIIGNFLEFVTNSLELEIDNIQNYFKRCEFITYIIRLLQKTLCNVLYLSKSIKVLWTFNISMGKTDQSAVLCDITIPIETNIILMMDRILGVSVANLFRNFSKSLPIIDLIPLYIVEFVPITENLEISAKSWLYSLNSLEICTRKDCAMEISKLFTTFILSLHIPVIQLLKDYPWFNSQYEYDDTSQAIQSLSNMEQNISKFSIISDIPHSQKVNSKDELLMILEDQQYLHIDNTTKSQNFDNNNNFLESKQIQEGFRVIVSHWRRLVGPTLAQQILETYLTLVSIALFNSQDEDLVTTNKVGSNFDSIRWESIKVDMLQRLGCWLFIIPGLIPDSFVYKTEESNENNKSKRSLISCIEVLLNISPTKVGDAVLASEIDITDNSYKEHFLPSPINLEDIQISNILVAPFCTNFTEDEFLGILGSTCPNYRFLLLSKNHSILHRIIRMSLIEVLIELSYMTIMLIEHRNNMGDEELNLLNKNKKSEFTRTYSKNTNWIEIFKHASLSERKLLLENQLDDLVKPLDLDSVKYKDSIEYIWNPANSTLAWLLAARILFSLLIRFPSVIRNLWQYSNSEKAQKCLQNMTRYYFSPSLIKREIEMMPEIVTNVTNDCSEETSIKYMYNESSRILKINYENKEVEVSLIISFSQLHPLIIPKASIPSIPGISKKQISHWLVPVIRTIKHGTLGSAISIWAQNVHLHFRGIDECPICYSILHTQYKTLPRKSCQTCKHIFHSECIYKWFRLSHKTTCPLCVNIMQ
ncbi:zinc C3HC4 type domain-containing protein [Cryptosporidium andersoni]|uniref:E3 ubiquitin-protein ligase listerin n=1 Tax=Cryptosporidium andersoni TaxID=117008 RepID=A0A1J4MN07_9CRYT|nr:zinc C3HC4 type domain-containing protein [Cryptosporidium andersoni]